MDTLQHTSLLVTGASGFIGSFIVARALDLGMQVWAAIREGSSRRYLQDKRIHFITLDLEHQDTLTYQLRTHQDTHGAWDYIVHAAGATKARSEADFFRVNTEGTRHLCEALITLQMVPKRFVFMSSLSIFGPIRETATSPSTDGWVYRPILDTDTPQPNTAYGRSKWAAEQYLHKLADFPYVVLRPTGVYGPRETDYFLMAKSIKQRIDFGAGYRPQELTFVYVKDLVEATFLALLRAPIGSSYFITDGGVYSSRTYANLLQEALGVRGVCHITAPLWLLHGICLIGEACSRYLGVATPLNADKYHILKQRNWQCDIAPARAELGYVPQYTLARGVAETIAWYREHHWL